MRNLTFIFFSYLDARKYQPKTIYNTKDELCCSLFYANYYDLSAFESYWDSALGWV